MFPPLLEPVGFRHHPHLCMRAVEDVVVEFNNAAHADGLGELDWIYFFGHTNNPGSASRQLLSRIRWADLERENWTAFEFWRGFPNDWHVVSPCVRPASDAVLLPRRCTGSELT